MRAGGAGALDLEVQRDSESLPVASGDERARGRVPWTGRAQDPHAHDVVCGVVQAQKYNNAKKVVRTKAWILYIASQS